MSKHRCPFCGAIGHWHTRKWYYVYWGIDPETTGLEPRLKANPHYLSSPHKMKLWAECRIKGEILDIENIFK